MLKVMDSAIQEHHLSQNRAKRYRAAINIIYQTALV